MIRAFAASQDKGVEIDVLGVDSSLDLPRTTILDKLVKSNWEFVINEGTGELFQGDSLQDGLLQAPKEPYAWRQLALFQTSKSFKIANRPKVLQMTAWTGFCFGACVANMIRAMAEFDERVITLDTLAEDGFSLTDWVGDTYRRLASIHYKKYDYVIVQENSGLATSSLPAQYYAKTLSVLTNDFRQNRPKDNITFIQ